MEELTEAQRDELRLRVADEARRTAARLAALRAEFDDIVASSADAVRDDEHDPEGQTIAFERAQVASLADAAEARLTALERAAASLEEAGAGACERCAAPIGFERLRALPTATHCAACAS